MRLIDADAFDKALSDAQRQCKRNGGNFRFGVLSTVRENLANAPTIQPDAPRLMTLQEILEAKRPFYIEKKECEDGDKEWRGWGLVEYEYAGNVLFVVMGKDLRLLCEVCTMGRFFRCWTAQPTAEQMEATPWDN